MSQRVDEIRDQIYKARSDGYVKEDMVIVVSHNYLTELRNSTYPIQRKPMMDGSVADEIDGVPIVTVSWLREDDMMLVTGPSHLFSEGRGLSALGLSKRSW